jgi:hypothetical protein
LEKLGKPGVAVVADSFLSDALSSAQDASMPALRIVALPGKAWYTARSQEPRMKEVAAAAFDSIIDALKRPLTAAEEQGEAGAAKKPKTDDATLKFSGATYNDALEAVSKGFLERHWSDGLPITPPTKEAVKRMLTGTSRSPDEVIGNLPAKGGKVTIRNIAINAVMAGAKPEYLPVIIAAIEAITGGKLSVLHLQASAGCVSPLIFVNGPIVAELGINSGLGYMGHGFRANNTIGRAVRLNLINGGHMWPGQNDMCLYGRTDAFGTSTFGENEQESPWKPYHVEQGFKPEESTVTVVNVMNIKRGPGGPVTPATPYQSLVDLANVMNLVSYPAGPTSGEVFIAMDPTFAQQLSQIGFSKNDVKWWLFLHARIPYEKLAPSEQASLKRAIDNNQPPSYLWTWVPPSDKSGKIEDLPRVRTPEEVHIVIAGASPGYSFVWESPTGNGTKLIHGATLTQAGR